MARLDVQGFPLLITQTESDIFIQLAGEGPIVQLPESIIFIENSHLLGAIVVGEGSYGWNY